MWLTFIYYKSWEEISDKKCPLFHDNFTMLLETFSRCDAYKQAVVWHYETPISTNIGHTARRKWAVNNGFFYFAITLSKAQTHDKMDTICLTKFLWRLTHLSYFYITCLCHVLSTTVLLMFPLTSQLFLQHWNSWSNI